MNIQGKLTNWQKRLLDDAVLDAVEFIAAKYNIDKTLFDLIVINCSSTCRFAKYSCSKGVIRLHLRRYSYVKLYIKKSLGNYNNIIHTSAHHAYACQLIHELTHFVQDLEDRCFSEVETTQNEIEYLTKLNYMVNQK